MPFVVLLHGRGSKKHHQNERHQQQHVIEERFLEGRSPSTSRTSTSPSSCGSYSPSSSTSSSASASPRPSRAPTPFGRSTPLCLNNLSQSTSSTGSSPLDSEIESSVDEEPNICGLRANKKINDQSLRSSLNVRFDHLPSFSEFRSNSSCNSKRSHRGPSRLCVWKVHPTVFKGPRDESQKDPSTDASQELLPDELVLNPYTFEVWLNGKKYSKPRFTLHHLHPADNAENVSAFMGEIHLTLRLKASDEIKLVRLVAPFLCRFDIWSQLSSPILSRSALANLNQMLGLKVGHWKLQIEYTH